jgi:hypothetical protein
MPGDDAFRPTNPGHSPGVGHQTPPSLQIFI